MGTGFLDDILRPDRWRDRAHAWLAVVGLGLIIGALPGTYVGYLWEAALPGPGDVRVVLRPPAGPTVTTPATLSLSTSGFRRIRYNGVVLALVGAALAWFGPSSLPFLPGLGLIGAALLLMTASRAFRVDSARSVWRFDETLLFAIPLRSMHGPLGALKAVAEREEGDTTDLYLLDDRHRRPRLLLRGLASQSRREVLEDLRCALGFEWSR